MNMHSETKYMIIMRHGDQCSQNGLTEKGKEQVKTAAKTLESNGFSPDLLITSFPDRTKLSASILSNHFNIAVSRTTDLLDVLDPDFDMAGFLKSLPQDARTITLTGHDESIQCFGHYLLNDQDTAILFRLVPESRILNCQHDGHSNLYMVPEHADALILQCQGGAENINDWRLYGWMADGDIQYAHDIIPIDPALSGAKKFQKAPDIIELAVQLPDGP